VKFVTLTTDSGSGHGMNGQHDFAIDERLLRRICGEYLEMPGLRLTCEEAQRLWGLDEQICASLVEFLVDVKFLYRTSDGRFARTEGMTSLPPLRMMKAGLDRRSAGPQEDDPSTAA
jgi:hypothetical protein